MHDDDRKTREDGYSHKELRKFKIVRLLKEAYEQNGVLSQADVAEMLGVSIGTPDIARITGHTEEACDRYIEVYHTLLHYVLRQQCLQTLVN